jgi:hypothetical protein
LRTVEDVLMPAKQYWFTIQNPGDTELDERGLWVLDEEKIKNKFSNFIDNYARHDEVAIYEKGRGIVALAIVETRHPRGLREGPDNKERYWRRYADTKIISDEGSVSLEDTYQVLSGRRSAQIDVMSGFLVGKFSAGVGEISESKYKEISTYFKDYNNFFEANEGDKYSSERDFRRRNGKLIALKKANSNYQCEVCDMKYKSKYGTIGKRFIIAHHCETIGGRSRSTPTTLEDIALVCSNCHDMLHRKNPPYGIEELRAMINDD